MSWNLGLIEPSGFVQACNGIALPIIIIIIIITVLLSHMVYIQTAYDLPYNHTYTYSFFTQSTEYQNFTEVPGTTRMIEHM